MGKKFQAETAARHHSHRTETVNDLEDEEINEDEAFNSEDERKYSDFFASSTSLSRTKMGVNHRNVEAESESESSHASDDENGILSDDDDDEGDGGQYMLDLLEGLGKSQSEGAVTASQDAVTAVRSVKESEFSASVVKGTNLTIDTLMSHISDTKGFKSLQRTVASISGVTDPFGETKKALTTTKAPAPRVVSERALRKVNYEDQKKEASRWGQVVKQNREAETLDFRPKGRIRITKDSLVENFEPETDFEKEVAVALERAGANQDAEIVKREKSQIEQMDSKFDDDLGGNGNLTMDEFKTRQGELAKMRALLFYEEQKAHHINKIKSKKYRRIRKKRRDTIKENDVAAQAADDPQLARELEEKEELERMRERMTLAHNNTSKWAKQQLKRGKRMDVDARKALSAQIRRGDDLRQKMKTTGVVCENDDEEGSDSDDLVAQAKALLDETTTDAHAKAEQKGILKMAFMQRGLQIQRERAKEEARRLLGELEQDESKDGMDGKSDERGNSDRPAKLRCASAAETAKVLQTGKLVATELEFGKSNSVQMSGGVSIDVGLDQPHVGSENESSDNMKNDEKMNANRNKTGKSSVRGGSDFKISLSSTADVNGLKKSKDSRTDKMNRKPSSQVQTAVGTAGGRGKEASPPNPWLHNSRGGSISARLEGGVQKGMKAKSCSVVDVVGAASILVDEECAKKEKQNREQTKASSGTATVLLSQEELVRRAFAAPTDVELEDEFEKEKEEFRLKDDASRKPEEKRSVSGWGSWAGEGVPPPRPRKFPKGLEPPAKRAEKRKRKDDGIKTVIINEKRVKKNINLQINTLPYPYTSREEYEKAMAGAIGKEWNITTAVKGMTRPEIQTRTGRIIKPLPKKAKSKRPPAKF